MCPSPFNPMNHTAGADTARNVSSIDPRLSRTHYYDGRLLKASDLIRDQLYLDERLREAGRAIGHGIVRGLEVRLDEESQIWVTPGLAVAPSGRVLELEQGEALQINLFDLAKIAELNPGFRYFERGIYAVAVQYAEQGEGSAEVYPQDLQQARGFHFNAFAEGVEVTLIPLHVRQTYRSVSGAGQNSAALVSRAALMRELLSNPGQPPELPEHAVALGLLSLEGGRPQWLDQGLVRRPHRAPNTPHTYQLDLHHHYQELLSDLMQWRQSSLRQSEFPASQYFELLPPFGALPEEAIDPVKGRQGFFPESFDVSVAPVRRDDVPAILEQSRRLEPIDLRRDIDVDIMVLVLMSDYQFAARGRQLEHQGDEPAGHSALKHLDSLALKLYGTPSVHGDSPDNNLWLDVMAQSEGLMYVRRPTRVAETQVSAVVLAKGYDPDTVDYEALPDIEAWDEERVALETQVNALKEENDQLREELGQDTDERLTEAQNEIDQLKVERDDLQNKLLEAEKRINELLEGGGDTEGLNARIEALGEELKAAQRRIEELEGQLRGRGSAPDLNDLEILEPKKLAETSGFQNEAAVGAVLEALSGSNSPDEDLKNLNAMVRIASPTYAEPLWASVPTLIRNAVTGEFVDYLLKSASRGLPLGLAVGSSIGQFKLSSAQREAWVKIDFEG